jgi:hypothetical protein
MYNQSIIYTTIQPVNTCTTNPLFMQPVYTCINNSLFIHLWEFGLYWLIDYLLFYVPLKNVSLIIAGEFGLE